ncbi:hypothetical protein FGO68_gene183 [Halteria grandinella]|uniref:Uncharacterized protein n=1 Tax=Halteria grandinella TaxID=5974 RepID=A0A8J8P514_HALGN|nr:hypothetical protein FGO68_gene183 [Halteria grandinella]
MTSPLIMRQQPEAPSHTEPSESNHQPKQKLGGPISLHHRRFSTNTEEFGTLREIIKGDGDYYQMGGQPSRALMRPRDEGEEVYRQSFLQA